MMNKLKDDKTIVNFTLIKFLQDKELQNLLVSMLRFEERNRATFQSLISNEFWEKIALEEMPQLAPEKKYALTYLQFMKHRCKSAMGQKNESDLIVSEGPHFE
jgi:hypothetical protein